MLTRRKGFSLVELAIVLVILGLLVGGVLSGRALIRASELRKFRTDIDKYTTASLTFRDKYFALPGDCPNFVSFFTGSLNGNGNGRVGIGDQAPGGFDPGGDEGIYLWNHLSLAGLIEGKYTGDEEADGGNGGYYRIGQDVPKASVSSNNFYFLQYQPTVTSLGSYIPVGEYGHIISARTWRGNHQYDVTGANSTSEEGYLLDVKYDDGKPQTGKVRAGLTRQDLTGADAYDPSATGTVTPMFLLGF